MKATTKERKYKTAAVPELTEWQGFARKEISGAGGKEAVAPRPSTPLQGCTVTDQPPPSLSKSIYNEIICTNLWQINSRNHSCFETSVWNNCMHFPFNFPFCQHKKKVKHFYKMSQWQLLTPRATLKYH